MQKIRQYLEQFFKITGAIFTIRELLIILGVSGGMVTLIATAIAQFFSGMPWGYRIALLVFIFMLVFAGVWRIILNRKKRVIPNKQVLINAIAEFELRARNVFTGKGSSGDYQKACDDLQKETLVANLAGGDNPISELVVFAVVQVAWKQGKIMNTGPIYYFKTPLEFVGSLRGKAMKARQWIDAISK